MADFPSSICPHCGEPIANRFFVRDRSDDVAAHFDCHQRARREAAPVRGLPERPLRSRSMTPSSAIAEAIEELHLYADTNEGRAARALTRLLVGDLDDFEGSDVH